MKMNYATTNIQEARQNQGNQIVKVNLLKFI